MTSSSAHTDSVLTAEQDPAPPPGPDLAAGFPLASIPDGELFAAHAFGKPILVVRHGDVVRAIGGSCTHYGGPLADGLLDGDTVRCPWHHACFDLTTGEALRAPALNPVAVWALEVRHGVVYALKERATADGATQRVHNPPVPDDVREIVIVGAGAAGSAAAEMLRRQGFEGTLTMLSADDALPYDRPNLSKDYLAGSAPEEWIPLRSAEFYATHRIDVVLNVRATAIDIAARRVRVEDGPAIPYDRLLLATGATPIRLPVPGAELPHVHYLRTLSDSRAIAQAAVSARTAVVIGASFIGLEVAAALRARDVAVHVVAPETVPLERVMGREVGAFIQGLHERHGVVFHLGRTASAIGPNAVTLDDSTRIAADLVVIGVGVKPETALAETAGLVIDHGVMVDHYLESNVPGIYAAGDNARWPDPLTGIPIRVEHWVVAQRHGQTAAKNMLGRREPCDAVPFFWSAHYDTAVRYVGHASRWDSAHLDGDLERGAATVTLSEASHMRAVLTVGRDADSLRAEVGMETRRGV